MSAHTDYLVDLPKSMYSDLAMLMCGEYLGGGIARRVFSLRGTEDKVIKLQFGDGFQNIVEYEVWEAVRYDKRLAPWFAPVHQISGLGQWVIQERTQPIQKHQLPKQVPTVFTDIKQDNWGWLKGKPVCHDYGTIMCRLFAAKSSKMRKADWS